MGRCLPVLFLILSLSPVLAGAQRLLTIRGHHLSVPRVMEWLIKEGDHSILYVSRDVAEVPPVDLDLVNVPVRRVLHECFAGTRFRVELIADKVISISRERGASLYADLTGTVSDTLGAPLVGATITDLRTRISVLADAKGRFRLPAGAFETLVTISCTGYTPLTDTLSNKDANDIQLIAATAGLDAVMITAYGRTTQRLTTGSVTRKKAPELEVQPVPTITDALEGRVPRLVIRRYNGVLGSACETLLGGRHSVQQGNGPLYVLDGVPLAGGSFLSPIGSGSAQGQNGANPTNGIPTWIIGSTEVLKDATATAIYGSRAANGVILLTTKEWIERAPHWTAEVAQGASGVVPTSRPLITAEFLTMRKEAVSNDGLPVNASTVPEAYVWDSTRYRNYQRLTTGGTGSYRDLRLSFNGGNKQFPMLVYTGAHNETGVFPGTTRDQHLSLYTDIGYHSGNDRLKLNFAASVDRQDNLLPREDYTSYEWLAPNAPSFTDAAGQPQWGSYDMPFKNIPALGNNTYKSGVVNLFGRLHLDFRLDAHFSLEGSIGGHSILAHEQNWQTIAGQNPLQRPSATGNTVEARDNLKSGILELWGRFANNAKWGRLDALAGITYQSEGTDYSSIQLSGVSSDLLLAAGTGAAVVTPYQDRVHYRYEALFGQLHYTFRDRYLLEVTGRRDGSSRFGPGDQFGNFWGLGGGWIFSEERFVKRSGVLSFGKIKGSYGSTGNDQIGDDQFSALYTPTASARGYQGQQGVIPASLSNDQLHWELNYRGDLSVDLGFFHNKLLITAGLYEGHSKSQLVYTGLPAQAGFPGVLSNQPVAVVNKGLEFQLDVNHLFIGRLIWSSFVTATIPHNYLASWPGLNNSVYAATVIQGRSLTVTRGLHYLGVDPATGLYRFQDVNHNGTIDAGDLMPGPSLDPRWYGGWGHTLRCKGWGLDLFFEYRTQNAVNPLAILAQRNPAGMQGLYNLSNGPKEWLDHWRQPGDHAKYQMLTSMPGTPAWNTLQEWLRSDGTIVDASFLRWKNLSIQYEFSAGWCKRRHLKALKCYVRGENLWTRTRFPVTDPETQDPTVLAPMRTLLAGFQVSF